jgi:antitoxin VapB
MAFEAIDINNKSGFQEIKIPENLKIDDNKVYLRRIGNALYIIPYHNPWQNMIDSLDNFTNDFMEQREQPDNQTRESLDL